MTTPTKEEDSSILFEIPEQYLIHEHDNIYTTTAHQFAQFNEAYKRFPLPDNILFPWLHGVDGLSNQQNLFFGVRRSMVPNYRGLMIMHCQELEHTARLTESVLPHQVLFMEPPYQYEFINSYNKETNINLRNFGNQVSRFATICDIVLYGTQARKIATLLSLAQQKLYQERQDQIESVQKSAGKRAVINANRILYKTIIIEDDFSVFERNYPEFVLYDSIGSALQRKDFRELEIAEMRKMSEATEITKNIWLGNTQDVPITIQEMDPLSSSFFSDFNNDENPNPHHFSICIEAHDLADMPLPSTLMLARETLNELKDGQMPSELIHFDVYATGVPNEEHEFQTFFTHLLQLLQFMEEQSSRDRRILIHCSDGYTESSLLALSWIMFHQKLQLPEAYLYLQRIRSFFVYAADVPTLRRIEHALFEDHESLEPQPKRRKSTTLATQNVGSNRKDNGQTIMVNDTKKLDTATITKEEITVKYEFDEEEEDIDDVDDDDDNDDSDDDMMEMQHLTTPPTPLKTTNNRALLGDAYINAISNTEMGNALPTDNIYKQLQLSPTKEEEELYPWFYSPRFEGSFPSRILSFLYLGNLNHATNPEMLKVLNITHIVSVGENADLSDKEFNLLFLDNLYDDGIDSIQSRLDSVVRFVEDARLKGTTCLIHCRVGVSRSAAILICYIMKHLQYTLVQAYLFVRARRLNVIIQPNLKFMYEMLQLEQREKGTISITWPILCNEIYNLNSPYRNINCLP
ncbi:uncharacterized protein BX663DRAFT_554175 [Cokeromyces recurvatus]|uniref:uncharacterized protein n=1 Tax=Cokeromyces recurvatus TaxID=90255 RepID=UPI002220086F|nr:uncharacterized protein BX663DRAFT_554175 [Cokeromyces recurvatus]KAI7900279.1 hypothetical protein BX663DRAFT_554175 [Cokeromyces recurvatus]